MKPTPDTEQERVITEKAELDARIARLEAALEKGVEELLQRDLMNRQLAYMQAYSTTLRHRIEAF